MSEDDLRTIVRAVKEAQAAEFDSLHAQMAALHAQMTAVAGRIVDNERRISDVETGFVNSVRDISRRLDRHIETEH